MPAEDCYGSSRMYCSNSELANTTLLFQGHGNVGQSSTSSFMSTTVTSASTRSSPSASNVSKVSLVGMQIIRTHIYNEGSGTGFLGPGFSVSAGSQSSPSHIQNPGPRSQNASLYMCVRFQGLVPELFFILKKCAGFIERNGPRA